MNIVKELEQKVMAGKHITFEEALDLLSTDEMEELFAAANRIRKKFNGNSVDLCTIMNAKSGRCSENCKFCAQSGHFNTGVDEYPLVDVEKAVKMALENENEGAHRFSLVTSGKCLSPVDFTMVIQIYQVLREKTKLKLCASLGLLSYKQAVELKEAGVTMYHHNVETSRRFFPHICDTHTYDERIQTIKNAMKAGLDICCGGILGMGETAEDRISMAIEIRELGVKSVPINILNPIPGTPLENMEKLDPKEILATIAVYRFIIPNCYIRYAGGRASLGKLQRSGLKAGVNAVLVGNYLTTVGNKIHDDIKMLREEGLEI